ncbi:hypothetical protein HGA92_02715 [Candidatus Gracilibacteria bacterium]|nr:hypothetical protein [Candidatus Gracilibacteria bacterium]NUJ98329.1 hypothetical protein [Candidatus Gracilibacteria bacterium]NUJ99316.1 hypothetical protein [Candidatus Gracilibacteria bacterium]
MDEIQKQVYEKKRELILSVLESLFGYWDLAEGIHALVSSQFVTQELLDSLTQILSDAIENVQDEKIKKKIQKGLELIEKIREIEAQERAEDIKLAELELLKL